MAGIGYKTLYEALYDWAVENGKYLPLPEEMICKESNFNSILTYNNNQSVLSSL
jgi:hypothetical protein